MKAASKISTLVTVLLVLAGTVLAQDRTNGNLAERQKAPTVMGGTGLFNTLSTRTLCKGEFSFGLFWNRINRDPGDLTIDQVPINFTYGLTNRWELWVDWVAWQRTRSESPYLLSGYQYSAASIFGRPFDVLGPVSGGTGGSTAFFPGTGSLYGGILPVPGALSAVGSPLIGPANPLLNIPGVVGLGPSIATDRPGFYQDLPFFGEAEFGGFDSAGRPLFNFRESSNGTSDVYLGTKYNFIDPNKHWFSLSLAGYLKIPISRDDEARIKGRTNGVFEGGPILILGQETGGHRVRFYENFGYIHVGDIKKNDIKVLDLRDKLLLRGGMSVAVNPHVEFVSELDGTVYVGGGTRSFNPVNPLDLNLGLRFFFKDGAISFGGAYRRFLTDADDRQLLVNTLSQTVDCCGNVTSRTPGFAFQQYQKEGSANGFVAYFSIGRRKACPPPPAPTCVVEATPGTVNRGDRLTITSRPTTPGYAEGKVTYEYRYDVKDAQGRPVTVSGTGATVDVATAQIACGTYTVTTTVTATVPAVDCPSNCVTTGQTTCTATFTVTEPPCPPVTAEVSATPNSVTAGDRVTLRANARDGGNFTYTWSTTGGSLSATTGPEVTLDTAGATPGTITVTVNVATDRTRCNEPCPGTTATAAVTVNAPAPPAAQIVTPCGPIFFPVNSARINNEHKACLDEIALRLQQDPRASVVIDGHRDATERVGISLTRANNARDYLVNEKAIDAARITVRNLGDTCPHESGDPALNRRVEFWIVPEGASVSGIDAIKKCAAGATPRVITDEQPAKSVEPRKGRRHPVRRHRARRPEPVTMTLEP